MRCSPRRNTRPHFFLYGRLVALYVCGQNTSSATTDELVLQTLRTQMGQEFAGGAPLDARETLKYTASAAADAQQRYAWLP